MKILICFFPLFFLLLSCKEDNTDDNVEQEEDYLYVYLDSLYQHEFTNNDTIIAKLGTLVKLYVKASNFHSDTRVVYDNLNIGVECVSDGVYLCTPVSKGTKHIYFIADGCYCRVNFNVNGRVGSFYIEENTYTIEVPSSNEVKESILRTLSSYMPHEGNLLVMDYETLYSGAFNCYGSDHSGTFSVGSDSVYHLEGDGINMDFTLEKIGSDSQSFLIRQDLTDEFSLLYPDEEISSVQIISLVQEIGQDYYR